MYERGQGLPQDYIEALKWYRKAADQGLPEAATNIGTLYEKGQGVTQDYSEALEWYRKGAEQGSVEAEHNLGSCTATAGE